MKLASGGVVAKTVRAETGNGRAISRMVAFLLTGPNWKPDKPVASKIRRCSECKVWMSINYFTPEDHVCRPCRKVMSQWYRDQHKAKLNI